MEMEAAHREYPPCAALAPFVECYWMRVSCARPCAATPSHRVLPDGCMDIVFNFGEPLAVGRDANGRRQRQGGAVVGTMTTPLLLAPAQRDDFLGVRFRPGRARAFLRMAAAEVTDAAVALDSVWGREGRELEERLAAARVAGRRVALLEAELLRRLRNEEAADPYVNAVVDLILEQRGAVSVQFACDFAGITRQHLARRFEQYVGIRPKLFSRVVRFRRLLAEVAAGRPMPWSALAADFGYYDQAHLIADFRQFTGVTPENFRASL